MPSRAVMRIAIGVISAAILGSAAWGQGAPAARAGTLREHDPPAELRLLPFTGALPSCADPAVLGEIAKNFAYRETEFWGSGLAIAGFEWPGERGYRSNGLSYIPRRYCQAEATFNDGVRRLVVYNIGEAQGFIGIGSGVTWCVQGLDRNHAFSPNCRAAGP
jgi:hypothetical protein